MMFILQYTAFYI